VRSDRERLGDILERCRLLREHVAGRTDQLADDPVLQAATLYWIQIIGEAAANASQELRQRHPDLPWQEMIGMRNIVVHGYFGIDVDIVREVVERRAPELESRLMAILEERE
jgi:uncharacterized protein with HEPN domain